MDDFLDNVLHAIERLGVDLVKHGWQIREAEVFNVDIENKCFYCETSYTPSANASRIYEHIIITGKKSAFIWFYFDFNYVEDSFHIRPQCQSLFEEYHGSMRYTTARKKYLMIVDDKRNIHWCYTLHDFSEGMTPHNVVYPSILEANQTDMFAESGLINITEIRFVDTWSDSITLNEKFEVQVPATLRNFDYMVDCIISETNKEDYHISVSMVKIQDRTIKKTHKEYRVHLEGGKLKILLLTGEQQLPKWTDYINHPLDFFKNPNNIPIWESHLSKTKVVYQGASLFIDQQHNAYIPFPHTDHWVPIDMAWLSHYCTPDELAAYLAISNA